MSLGYIMSPAKKMNVLEGPPYVRELPRFIEKTRQLMHAVQALNYNEAKTLWKCSDALAELNYERFATMDLERDTTAAILAYEGIQYQYLAPGILEEHALDYLAKHLRILSGFYGVLRPSDGVVPYRLEMQAALKIGQHRNLYDFWGPTLAESLSSDFDLLVNLASVEYSKAVLPYCAKLKLPVISCLFGTLKAGKFIQRSTEAKAARGSFCRWCAQRKLSDVEELRSYNERGYRLSKDLSDNTTLIFLAS